MSEVPRDPDLTAVEAALASLTPSAGCLDRDRLLFLAGRASRERGRWRWPSAAAAASLLAACLGAALAFRPAVRVVVVTVEKQAPPDVVPSPVVAAPPDEPDAWPATGYHRVLHQVLRSGLDGLPAPPAADRPTPPTRKQLLDTL